MTTQSPADLLNELRVDIDRIDAGMHELLIERGGIIERLIAVKARQGGGSAFRPGRESDMMRRLAERHRGPLPFDTVESIWRVIISTFTFVQAGYSVHADISVGDAAMRDSARFHFGFTVPLLTHKGAAEVIAAVAAGEADLGLLPVIAPASVGPWWHALASDAAPKIIARLPFVERSSHPAGLPVFVIAKPGAAAAARDEIIYGLTVGDTPQPAERFGGRVLASAAQADGMQDQHRLVSVPTEAAAGFTSGLEAADPRCHLVEIGSHSARFAIT